MVLKHAAGEVRLAHRACKAVEHRVALPDTRMPPFAHVPESLLPLLLDLAEHLLEILSACVCTSQVRMASNITQKKHRTPQHALHHERQCSAVCVQCSAVQCSAVSSMRYVE